MMGSEEWNNLMRSIGEHMSEIYKKHIDENSLVMTKKKARAFRTKQNHRINLFTGRDIVIRPHIQMYKTEEVTVNKKKVTKKLSTNQKKTAQAHKMQNPSCFDPDGDSVKKYKELYTYKNLPGIRTRTIIKEALDKYNRMTQKAKMKKSFHNRLRKERCSSESPVSGKSILENTIIKVPQVNKPKRKAFKRSKTKKSVEGKSTEKSEEKEICEVVKSTLEKPILLPSKGFLDRNTLRRTPGPRFLYRVKPSEDIENTVPVPVVNIGITYCSNLISKFPKTNSNYQEIDHYRKKYENIQRNFDKIPERRKPEPSRTFEDRSSKTLIKKLQNNSDYSFEQPKYLQCSTSLYKPLQTNVRNYYSPKTEEDILISQLWKLKPKPFSESFEDYLKEKYSKQGKIRNSFLY